MSRSCRAAAAAAETRAQCTHTNICKSASQEPPGARGGYLRFLVGPEHGTSIAEALQPKGCSTAKTGLLLTEAHTHSHAHTHTYTNTYTHTHTHSHTHYTKLHRATNCLLKSFERTRTWRDPRIFLAFYYPKCVTQILSEVERLCVCDTKQTHQQCAKKFIAKTRLRDAKSVFLDFCSVNKVAFEK